MHRKLCREARKEDAPADESVTPNFFWKKEDLPGRFAKWYPDTDHRVIP